MSDNDLSRYTCIEDGGNAIRILRRVGLYGQDIIATLIRRTGTNSVDEQREIAHAICDYLDRRDRERDRSLSQGNSE
jgi:hypothetical protein